MIVMKPMWFECTSKWDLIKTICTFPFITRVYGQGEKEVSQQEVYRQYLRTSYRVEVQRL